MDISTEIKKIAQKAREASFQVARLSSEVKDRALGLMADGLLKKKKLLLAENLKDLEQAEKEGLSKAMLDRLALTEEGIDGIAEGLREIALLPDPVGEMIKMWRRPNGLLVGKMRIPLGVIGIIYEAKAKLSNLGVDLPRIEVRITEVDHKAAGWAYIGANVVYIPEQTLNKKYLKQVVLHEVVHAVTGFEHDEDCPLMCAKVRVFEFEDDMWKHFLKYFQ